jgi:heavy metal sensor kinase
MKPPSIRLRLTAWYIAVLLASLCIFGIAAFLAMKKGIERTVDENLEEQAASIEELMGRVIQEEPARLADELREHAELRAEGDFSQVCDQNGNWIYRSRLMSKYNVPLPDPLHRSAYDFEARGLPLRIWVREMSAGENKYRIQVAAPMDDFYEALDQFKWMVLLISPLLVALASAGGYWLSRRALAPVDQITRAAQEINSSNLSKRLDVPKSGDELQRLSETLNRMLERLEGSFNRITQFTADASHELRTPLALMRTTTEVSLRTSQTVSDYREAQTEVLEELEKTSSLVEKLMLLARADAGVETLQRVPVNLADCLREACDDGRVLAQAKQLRFQENISTSTMIVDADSHALHRLFLILIDNAVKYTPSGGSITVSLRRQDKSAVAEFQDSGIGIAAEDLPYIFDRFYRADKARSREFGGVGLGLSIARWVAEAHGGSIEVQSTLGVGSVFRVLIPLLEA